MRPTYERQPLFPKHGLEYSTGECADGPRTACPSSGAREAAGQRSWAGETGGGPRWDGMGVRACPPQVRLPGLCDRGIESRPRVTEGGDEEEEEPGRGGGTRQGGGEHGLLIRLRRRIEGRRGCGVWSTLLTALGGQRVGKHDGINHRIPQPGYQDHLQEASQMPERTLAQEAANLVRQSMECKEVDVSSGELERHPWVF
ncbi:hypothetical protein K456DRAFT_1765608 [Colletotrichum gloeosporioides 23]|nr:hypothetical protein K456DRAFT_1765608 [Colletotrichum gloeosporioides 23]